MTVDQAQTLAHEQGKNCNEFGFEVWFVPILIQNAATGLLTRAS